MFVHGLSDVKFYNATSQKKYMIRETSLLRHESPCTPLKIFKLLNKIGGRSNNEEKAVVVFSHIFCET